MSKHRTPFHPAYMVNWARLLLCAGALVGPVSMLGCASSYDEGDIFIENGEHALSGQTNPAADQILVCPDKDYGGNCQLVGLGLFPYWAGVPNDTMTSIKVGSAVRVTLCKHSEFRICYTYNPGRSLTNLGNERIGNDTVSSMRVIPASTPDCRDRYLPPSGWVFLYSDKEWQGDCVAVTNGDYWDVRDVGMQNDAISSLLVPQDQNTNLEIYKHQGFQDHITSCGDSWLCSYIWNSSFNDTISSLKVYEFKGPIRGR